MRHANGFCNLYGVGNSAAMAQEAMRTPAKLYMEYLKPLFKQVDILDACYGFVTLMAII